MPFLAGSSIRSQLAGIDGDLAPAHPFDLLASQGTPLERMLAVDPHDLLRDRRRG